MNMQLYEIIDRLEEIVPIAGTEQFPKTLINGELKTEIKKVGVALDFISSTLKMAKKNSCDLLLVHHGPPNYESISSEVTQSKIKLAKKFGISVYTLPFCLDISPLGSTAGFIKLMNFKAKSFPVVFQGRVVNNGVYKLKDEISHTELIKRLGKYPSSHIRVYGKPKRVYIDVAIAAGGGFQTDLIEQVKPEVYISGDLNIRAIRTAQELGILLIELSHSSMENFPFELTAKKLNKCLEVPVIYIEQEEPNVLVY